MSDVSNTYYAGVAFAGYGSQLMMGNGASPEVFEAIADLAIITPGKMSTAVIEKTHLRSPDAHKEKLATIRDSGAFTAMGNWRPTHQSQSNAGGGTGPFINGGLLQKWRARTEANFKIVLSDGSPGTEWPFRGVVTGFQPGAIGIEQKVDFTLEITPLQAFDSALP